ncbi:unnamed protein product [Arctia plantaginis]|uniref:Uncharacterized protein n=1 Tax=Arctia plantaginis TaxID=874455 RepID=A0A8S1A908_ARCPL|nr:unnamed protein product [Arctia plantaginis]
MRYKSKAELLEILEKGIRKKEKDRQFNLRNRDYVKRGAIITAVVVFVLLIILNLCSFVADIVILIYPFIAILIIVIISRTYTIALKKNQYKLYMMREEKKNLLEEVKISEKYLVAKELLEKYGSSEDLLPDSNSTNNVHSNFHRSTTINVE